MMERAGCTRQALPPEAARDLWLLEKALSLARRQDSEHLPVFRDGAPRDVDVLRAEDLDDLLIAVRLVPGLGGDNLPDLVVHRLARGVVAAVGAGYGGVDEEVQVVDALRRVRVFGGG